MRCRHAIAFLATVVAGLGLAACTTPGDAGSVTVLASWTGGEAAVFRQVLDRFTAQTGIRVDYQGTRAVSQVLRSDVEHGRPPDVAVLPGLGELAGYVRRDQVRSLGNLTGDSRRQQWTKLESIGNRRYAVAVKVDLKGLIWYNPNQLPDLPSRGTQSIDQLVRYSRGLVGPDRAPWCLGMGSTPTSGWPGTDWVEDILLHQAGPDFYRDWAAGAKPWTSVEVRRAWTTWGDLVAGSGMVRGGPRAAVLTDFGDAARPMFGTSPTCLMYHQASFMTGVFRSYDSAPKLVDDVNFVPFPGSTGTPAWEVSADLAALFHDTAQSRRLIGFLASDEAQEIWPRASNGTAFSANANVPKEVYGNPVSQRIAGILTGQEALCFDASDLMPSTMTTAFYRAVLEYLSDPGRLDVLLGQLDQVRAAVPTKDWVTPNCGR
jgi:alpha-glucoside transport system substrate-binding protein